MSFHWIDVIVQISNPREKQRLQKLITDLETSQPLILHAANDIMQNPQSEEAHSRLNSILIESRSKMEMFRIELTQVIRPKFISPVFVYLNNRPK